MRQKDTIGCAFHPGFNLIPGLWENPAPQTREPESDVNTEWQVPEFTSNGSRYVAAESRRVTGRSWVGLRAHTKGPRGGVDWVTMSLAWLAGLITAFSLR